MSRDALLTHFVIRITMQIINSDTVKMHGNIALRLLYSEKYLFDLEIIYPN